MQAEYRHYINKSHLIQQVDDVMMYYHVVFMFTNMHIFLIIHISMFCSLSYSKIKKREPDHNSTWLLSPTWELLYMVGCHE